jgi:hypothetical protein
MRHAVAMIVGLGLFMVVPVVVVAVAVRVPVHDPVEMGVGVRMVAGGSVAFGPVRHDARFGPKVGKAR